MGLTYIPVCDCCGSTVDIDAELDRCKDCSKEEGTCPSCGACTICCDCEDDYDE